MVMLGDLPDDEVPADYDGSEYRHVERSGKFAAVPDAYQRL